MKQKLIKVTSLFFVFMIAFTILSRVAYNLSVSQVEVIKPLSSTMNPKIKGEGQVSEKQETAVATVADQMVQSVFVAEGQAVEVGQVLYSLNMDKLAESINKKEQEINTASLQGEAGRSAVEASNQASQLARDQAADDYNRAIASGNEKVAQAESDLIAAEEAYQNYKANPSGSQGKDEATLVATVNGKQAAYDAAVKSRDDGIYAAQKSVDSASIEKALDTSVEQTEISKQQLAKELEKLQALFDAKGQINAPVKGVVTEVVVKTGGTTTGGGDILLADVSVGTKLMATFKEEDKKYLKRGGEVKISLNASEQDIEEKLNNLVITAITEGKEKDIGIVVTVDLPVDTLDIGMTATMEIETSSKKYDTCIPYEALHQGDKGKYYVNVLEMKESVLGNEQQVRRVNVTLLDKDEKQAAVEGITGEQEIITSTTKDIMDGSRVKRKES